MSEPISGFDARPGYDPTAEGFTPVTTDGAKLRQLIEYLEEHVSAYRDTAPVPWSGTAEEIAQARAAANDRSARLPDAIVHASMLVLGAGVDHTLPFVAYDGASADIREFDADGVPVRAFIPSDPTGAVVVAAHGGAWWMGDGTARDASFGPDCAALAQRSGAIVLDVDFRLVPEHPMPAAAEDLATVVRWVRGGSGGALGAFGQLGDEPRIVLWGRSSGGHAAVLAAKMLHDDAGVDLDSVALTAPSLDLRGRTGEMLRAIFGAPAAGEGEAIDPADPSVSPALGDASWIRRLHVQIGTADDVVSGGRELAEKVTAAGGEATVVEFLAAHRVAVPAVQRARITDLARHVLAATGTARDIAGEAVGEYDKDAIDRANEESWGR